MWPVYDGVIRVKVFERKQDAIDFFEKMQLINLFTRAIPQSNKIMFIAH